MRRLPPSLALVATLAIALAVALSACGGGGDAPTPPTQTPSPTIALTLAAGSVSVQQGGTGTVAAAVTRGGGYTGAAAFSVDNLPANVTAAASNVVTSAGITTALVTLTVGTTTPPGTYNLTARAAGSGVTDATAPLTLVVTPAVTGGYTLSATSVTVVQGQTVQSIVTIVRSGGFAGSVGFAVEGAPAGLTTTLTPSNATGAGTGSVLSIVAAATLAPGTYPLVVRGTTPGLPDRTATLNVVVTAPTGSANVRLDFSGCGADRPDWLAYQDGAGAWTRATGSNGVYAFTIASPNGGFAWVTTNGSASQLFVRYATRAELGAAPIVFCPALPVGTKLVTGTVAGLTGSQFATITLGGSVGAALATATTYTLPGIRPGAHDLVAYRQGSAASTADRIILRRDQDPTNGTALPVLDFAAAEAFAPATATFTLTGVGAGEAMGETMAYLTGASCDAGTLYTYPPLAAAHAAFGVPAAQQRPTDFHLVTVTASNASGGRSVSESFHTLAARTIAFGAPFTSPAVTTLPGPYKRLQATLGVSAEYTGGVTLAYIKTSGAPQSVTVTATQAYLGGPAVTLATPDLSGVAGWSASWAPASTLATRWTISAVGGNGRSPCTDGARTITASVQGQNP